MVTFGVKFTPLASCSQYLNINKMSGNNVEKIKAAEEMLLDIRTLLMSCGAW